ncbi:MAG: preprotein translocase subunit SecE [Clostridia bacterium]|nr:preprotein translocase subunit SecE [Clostridia bacterium]
MKSKNKAAENDFIVKSETDKVKEKEAKKVKKDKKPNIFKRMWLKIKDVFSELKKVTWPTFPKVVKQTGVVLLVVLVFLVVITAFDFGLLNLLKLVSPGVAG